MDDMIGCALVAEADNNDIEIKVTYIIGKLNNVTDLLSRLDNMGQKMESVD